jgi:hypothetical protein
MFIRQRVGGSYAATHQLWQFRQEARDQRLVSFSHSLPLVLSDKVVIDKERSAHVCTAAWICLLNVEVIDFDIPELFMPLR